MGCGIEGIPEMRGKMNVKQAINIAAAANTADENCNINVETMLAQMGRMNVAAISGGRVYDSVYAAVLPVSSGYHVVVSLAGNDTYTVRRVFVRGGKASVKGEWTNVYAEKVGDVAYAASCYR